MPTRRKCVCGKEFWFPGEFWQHKDCAKKFGQAPINMPEVIITPEKKPLATGSNRQYKEVPIEPADVVLVGWDGVERRKVPCAVCDAKKAKEREYMRKYRAKA